MTIILSMEKNTKISADHLQIIEMSDDSFNLRARSSPSNIKNHALIQSLMCLCKNTLSL